MSHLGERLTALVDGELGHDERDRVLAHLASCAECRTEAELLRRLKGRLRGLGGTPPPVDLVGRLSAMAESACPPPSARSWETPRRGMRGPGDNRPRGRSAAAVRRRVPRGRYLLAGAATLAVLGVGSASFAAGGDQGRLPQVSPSMQQFAQEHALTSGDVQVRLSDPVQKGGTLTTSGATRP